MTKKKIIMFSAIIGVGIVTYVAYKIISNWDKKIIRDKDFKIIISPDASTGIPDDDVVPIKPDEGMMNEFISSDDEFIDPNEYSQYYYENENDYN